MKRKKPALISLAVAIFAISPSAAAKPAITETAGKSIPEGFRGVWDLDLATCEKPGSDMRGYVEAKHYRFADTVGWVDQVESHSGTAITVSAKENSEGYVSFEKVRMELTQSGDVLILNRKTDRVRCPATKDD